MDLLVVKKRQNYIMIFFVLVVILSYGAVQVTGFELSQALVSIPEAIVWSLSNFYPTVASMKNLPAILIKLHETVFLAIVATTTGGICAMIFALLSTKGVPVFTVMCRLIASFFRNIPDTVWAIVLLLSFGQNVISGYIALFFATFGFLTRAFVETIEEVGASSIEALHAAGATYGQIVFQAIIPSCITQVVSWLLFMIETNIRSSTLVGMLTGTGIGNLFNIYYKFFDYHSASLVVIMIVIVILIIEAASNHVRRMIL